MSKAPSVPAPEPPDAFLRRFFIAMRAWELEAARASLAIRTGPHEVDPVLAPLVRQQAADALDAIFLAFCGRTVSHMGVSYSVPPSYNPATEEIVLVERRGRRVRVHTTRPVGPYRRLIYTLQHTSSGWRLLMNRVGLDETGAQEPWHLVF